MQFAAGLLQPRERHRGPRHEYCVRTGESFRAQSSDLLVIKAASVVGPLDDYHGPSVHEQVLDGLSALREGVLGEIGEAVHSSDAIFEPPFAEWMDEQLPSADELLARLI